MPDPCQWLLFKNILNQTQRFEPALHLTTGSMNDESMKTKKTILRFFCLTISACFFSACQDQYFRTYTVSEPLYMSYEELRSPVENSDPIPLTHPGKLYVMGDYLFVNETREGIHVIDNSDPYNPEVIRFLKIPGNVDLAIKGNILYADSYVDLVALDISDLNNIRKIARFRDIFEYSVPPYEASSHLGEVDESKGVVIGYETKEVTEEITTKQAFPVLGRSKEYLYDVRSSFMPMDVNSAAGGGGETGKGGSTARFIIYGSVLYTIDAFNLHMFDISDPLDPMGAGSMHIGWNIETVFIYNTKLFIGSMNGMYIYSLQDPYQPDYLSSYWHVTSCDPVVVEDHYAYITLRTGNLCEGDVNRLDVVDISNVYDPGLVQSYPMYNPHGLGIDGGTLFICDGDAGLKVFDASDPYRITDYRLSTFEEIHSFDVIPLGDILLMIGNDGIYQYDYTDVTDIQEMSFIPVFSR